MTSTNDSVSHRFQYHTVVLGPSRGRGSTLDAGEQAGTRRPGPVVVGVDGSGPSRSAARLAAALARSLDTEVVAVHALRLVAELMMDIPPMGLTAWRRQLEARLAGDWCAPLREAGVAYRAMLVERPVATALIGVAEREHASRIVVGTPHHGSIAHFGRGTLPERLSRRAPCPVVAVPAPGRDGLTHLDALAT